MSNALTRSFADDLAVAVFGGQPCRLDEWLEHQADLYRQQGTAHARWFANRIEDLAADEHMLIALAAHQREVLDGRDPAAR